MDEIVVIKSSNALIQYKNKWTFESQFSCKEIQHILYKYMAASHGKGLIDAMSSFCEKIILKRDIVDLDLWFSDSWENCEYLDMCKDLQMRYSVIGQASVDSKSKGKTARKIMASW